MCDIEQITQIIEATLFASDKPLTVAKLESLFDEEDNVATSDIQKALAILALKYENHAIELKTVASGYVFFIRDGFAKWVTKLWDEKPQRYSRALLETLAIIAYRQPVTRGDIEEIRGVAVSSAMTKTLLEREWIRVVGHRDVAGKPALYATTKQFLDYFGLSSLEQLPALSELKNIDLLGAKLETDNLVEAELETDVESEIEVDAELLEQ